MMDFIENRVSRFMLFKHMDSIKHISDLEKICWFLLVFLHPIIFFIWFFVFFIPLDIFFQKFLFDIVHAIPVFDFGRLKINTALVHAANPGFAVSFYIFLKLRLIFFYVEAALMIIIAFIVVQTSSHYFKLGKERIRAIILCWIILPPNIFLFRGGARISQHKVDTKLPLNEFLYAYNFGIDWLILLSLITVTTVAIVSYKNKDRSL